MGRTNGRDRSRSRTPERRRHRSRSKDREKSKSSRHRRSRSREKRSRSRERRSRSRDRRERRSYSRDRDRRRGDSKEKRISGSKSRRRDKTRSRSRSPKDSKNKSDDHSDLPFDPTNLDKEEEQRKLELEMQKRRERIERWRAERKKREQEAIKKEAQKGTLATNIPQGAVKKWSLEDDSEDEEKVTDKSEKEDGEGKDEENDKDKDSEKKDESGNEEEVDPLDAFMQGVHEEVRQINKLDLKKAKSDPSSNKKGGLVIVTGVAKSKVIKNKGELIEQNQDGLEYSSEEEQEDLKDTAANIANKQRKELIKIDHNHILYLPFRKNFYVEVPEIARMTQEEVDAYKEELEGIRVKGKGCPKPIKTWAQCGVSTKELNILKKLGFEKPTPIQAQAIPAIMSGRDLIGIAKTGSGKTLAFLLPMFRHILDQPPLEETDGPVSIIMTPTRELCMQIGKDIKKFTKSLNLHAVCVYGGTGISEQIAELKRGAEIIVCTPGRMIDMLAANGGKVTNLRRVTYIVLDEADRMFDMGFEPQ
ncbi:hypothetical protein ILUMI_20156, partial [Ignelater luminosus]